MTQQTTKIPLFSIILDEAISPIKGIDHRRVGIFSENIRDGFTFFLRQVKEGFFDTPEVPDDHVINESLALWQMTWKWARRRHPKKYKGWVKGKYYRRIKGRDWRFMEKGNPEPLILLGPTWLIRHIKVKAQISKLKYHSKKKIIMDNFQISFMDSGNIQLLSPFFIGQAVFFLVAGIVFLKCRLRYVKIVSINDEK